MSVLAFSNINFLFIETIIYITGSYLSRIVLVMVKLAVSSRKKGDNFLTRNISKLLRPTLLYLNM